MIDVIKLAQYAAGLRKESVATRRGRAGRNIKGSNIAKQLHAAGEPKMTGGSVFAYPRGQSV